MVNFPRNPKSNTKPPS